MAKKVRVHELAKELGTTSKKLIQVLEEMEVPIKNHMSTVDEETAQKVISQLTGKKEDKKEAEAEEKEKQKSDKTQKHKKEQASQTETSTAVKGAVKGATTGGKKSKKAQARKRKQKSEEEESSTRKVVLEGRVTVGEFASKLEDSSANVLSLLLDLGIVSNINQELSHEVIELLADEYGIEVIYKKDPAEEELSSDEEDTDDEDLEERYPVVTVLGHVDHGKTSLLDHIRKSNVTEREAGGITQHIGAYTVYTGDKGIVFLDTPGHEAFTAMRARGAQATDIAILVVAADDGVMPQTVEAINHVKAAGVSLIVAINKIDKKNANVERVKQQLTEQELVPEEWGGDTICVPLSSLTGEGIDELLEMIALLAELNDYKTNPNKLAKGIVIEAKLDKGRGPVATVLVQDGKLKVGEPVLCGTVYGKIRAMINEHGERVSEADSRTPVEIVGLSDVPEAGDRVQIVSDEKFARNLAEKRAEKVKEAARQTQRVTFDDLFDQIKKGEVKDLNLIIKGDVQGSLEALQDSLMKLSIEEVKIKIIHSGVGAITESDVMLAAASNAAIIGFNVRPDVKARKMAENEKVDIRCYRVIYEVLENVKAAISGMLEPEYEEVVQGVAEVRQVFKSSKVGNIAGSYVTDGRILGNSNIRVIRDGKTIHEGKIASLKRYKDDVKEVATGYECGILVENFNDVQEGDLLESYTLEEVKPV